MPSVRKRARCSSPEALPAGKLILPTVPSTRCQGRVVSPGNWLKVRPTQRAARPSPANCANCP